MYLGMTSSRKTNTNSCKSQLDLTNLKSTGQRNFHAYLISRKVIFCADGNNCVFMCICFRVIFHNFEVNTLKSKVNHITPDIIYSTIKTNLT